MVLVVLLLLLLQDLQVVVQLLSIELVKGFHLLITLLQILDVIFHFNFGRSIELHALDPQLFNRLLELLFLSSPAQRERLLHVNMLFEALLNFFGGFFNVLLPFLLKSSLDFIKLSNALVSEGKVLLSHFTDQYLDIAGLVFQGLAVLVVFFLEFFPELVDEFVFGSDDKFEGFLLLVDGLRRG